MKMLVKAGSPVQRKYKLSEGTPVRERFISTRDVIYTIDDLITRYFWPETSRIKVYIFRLPLEAAPWTELQVFPEYVELVDE